MAKEIMRLTINIMGTKITQVQRAKLGIEKARLEKEFEKLRQSEQKTVMKTCFDLWQNFDELSRSMAEADGKMTFLDIQNLSTSDFYRHKSWLHKKMRRTTTKQNEK